ncbi:MAG TPA: hypothetical protein GX692_03805 [Acholeplasmataceae bacterium]|nr:hypothetical protein [Acholeplasmataceae bacterium]
MKEVTSKKLDIIDNISEEEELTPKAAESSQNQEVPSTSNKSSVDDTETKMMDALEKVRAEERAKLEALQAREREKTRIMVERERARLEAELDKEIRALEAQLAKERAKFEKPAEPALSISLETAEKEAPDKDKEASKTAKTKTAAAKTKTPAATKAAADQEAEEKPVVQTVVDPIDLLPAEEQPLASDKTTAEALETPEVSETTPVPGVESEVAAKADKVELAQVDTEATGSTEVPAEAVAAKAEGEGIPAADPIPVGADILDKTPVPVSTEAGDKAAISAKAEGEGIPAADPIPIGTDILDKTPVPVSTEAGDKATISAKAADKVVSTDGIIPVSPIDIPAKADVKAEIPVQAKSALKEESPAAVTSSEAKADSEAQTVINSLEKLREKIYAQKQLERELLEKEAVKIQEKERMLQEKINNFDEELAAAKTAELESAQEQIESLLAESENQRKRIDELESVINKVKALKINNVTIIDENTFEISNDFLDLTKSSTKSPANINNLIKEIESELEKLTKEHQETLKKLRESEKLREEYQAEIAKLEAEKRRNQEEIKKLRSEVQNKEKLYMAQIKNLNQAILQAEEQLNKERQNSQENLAKLETLKYEKLMLENEVSGLKSEITMLKDKLQKRVDSGINTAARLDILEAEKALLENKIIQLNKQLVMKERVVPGDNAGEPYNYILSEIKRLKEEVNSLKTGQFPFAHGDYFSSYANNQDHHNCPYVRFFNPMLIPNLSYEPSALNKELVDEIRKLKNEFNEFKQERNNPVNNENNEEDDEKNRLIEAYANQIREYQEELERNKAELNLLIERNNQELEKLAESYEMQIQAKDKEKNMVKAEKEKLIQELQAKIQEKDALLDEINSELKRLTEDDILDPEFRRKIRVIRDMRRECEEKAEKEEKEFLRNEQAIKEKIDAKNLEIDVINDRIFQLEMNYKQNRDFSIEAQENYEKTKSKLMLERQLQEEKKRGFEDDMERLHHKYETFLENNAAEIEKLNNQEAETIEYFLNKLRRTKAKQMGGLRETEYERDELARQLDKLKEEEKPDEIEVDMPFVVEKEAKASADLENEIQELTRHYNEYYRQITELKAEQDKRIEAEKRLRMNEKNVYDYCTSKVNLDECLKSYQEKSRQIEDKQNELNQTSNRPEDRNAQLKLKAELQDLEVHRNDLRAKIEFYRNQIQNLERADIVQKYKSLLSQMEKINTILREKREQAQEIKALVQAKTKELEMLRG